jgi:hypothetical protein
MAGREFLNVEFMHFIALDRLSSHNSTRKILQLLVWNPEQTPVILNLTLTLIFNCLIMLSKIALSLLSMYFRGVFRNRFIKTYYLLYLIKINNLGIKKFHTHGSR